MDKNYQSKIQQLQKQPQDVYNICMIAHVDHGKTSLSDALISSNKIFSRKMNGKYLYMDFREDEKEREITMKSSGISLLSPVDLYSQQPDIKYTQKLINLIDSPGHIDFQFEVVSGLKITDGAILIIDSVEGVSSQTINLMKRAIENNMKLILFLNKIDKLIQILEMDTEVIYNQLHSIIETANAFMNIYLENKVQQELEKNPKHNIKYLREIFNVDDYFSPLHDNVIFGSIKDNWAFRTSDLAFSYAKKWNMKYELLKNYFWGDFYLDLKNKKLTKKDKTGKLQIIFVQYILNVIQKIYQCQTNKDFETLQKFALKLNLKIKERDMKNRQNSILAEIMYKWLPVDQTVYKAIIEKLPNALEGQQKRINQISENWVGYEQIKHGIMSCKQDATPIAVITKIFQLNIENQDKYVGFGRLYQGIIKKGDEVLMFNSKKEKKIIKCDYLYFWMGQTPIEIDAVYPGNIFGFCDVNLSQYKTSYFGPEDCPNLLPILNEQTLIKVRIKSKKLENMDKLVYGLKVLNSIDSVCDVYNDDKGELILQVNGEIHLERCLTDLKNIIPNVEVKLSEILVDFKESVQNQNYNLEKKYEENNLDDENESDEDSEDQNKNEEEQIQEKEIEKIEDQQQQIEKDQKNDKEIQQKLEQQKKAKKDWVRFEEEDYDYDYLKEEETQEQKEQREEQEEIEEEKQFFAQDDEIDRGSQDSLEYEDDSRFKMKKVNFVWKDIKKQTREVEKKSKNLKTKKYTILDKVKQKKNYSKVETPDKKIQIEIQCCKLPNKIIEFFNENEIFMKEAFNIEKKKNMISFFKNLIKLVEEEIQNPYLKVLIKKHLDCFGPRMYGPNMFINTCLNPNENIFNRYKFKVEISEKEEKKYKKLKELFQFNYVSKEEAFAFHSELNIGFHQAVLNGPLCGENIYGCIFILDSVKFVNENQEQNDIKLDELVEYFEEYSVQILRTIKEGCHDSFLGAQPKLVQSFYNIKAFCNDKTQNLFCELIKKKNGKIVDREYKYEFNMILVEAYLPVHQSYGLYSDILKATSGKVVPQMKFGGWEILDQDPFFEDQLTDELKEDHGEDFKIKNYTRELVESIRKRKGMALNQKIVKDGDKQITLSKKFQGKRTPIGSLLGVLKKFTGPQLSGLSIKALIEETKVDPSLVDELILGNVLAAGLGQNPVKQASLLGGLPKQIPTWGVQKVCASGMKSTALGATNIMCGRSEVVITGGFESMTNAPHLLMGLREGIKYGNSQLIDSLHYDGLVDAGSKLLMGYCGEKTVKDFDLSRQTQDEYCLASYERHCEAEKQGFFKQQIVPVEVPRVGQINFDEEPKKLKKEKVTTLKPVFPDKNKQGTITGANASKLNDGACALMLMSESAMSKQNLKPLAEIVDFADSECDPLDFNIAPSLAIQKLLQKQNLQPKDISYWEINEAFSLTPLVNMKMLEIPHSKMNVFGGAVAMGHPIGMSGARILLQLANVMQQHGGQYGVAAICNGGGGASAMLLKLCDQLS